MSESEIDLTEPTAPPATPSNGETLRQIASTLEDIDESNDEILFEIRRRKRRPNRTTPLLLTVGFLLASVVFIQIDRTLQLEEVDSPFFGWGLIASLIGFTIGVPTLITIVLDKIGDLVLFKKELDEMRE